MILFPFILQLKKNFASVFNHLSKFFFPKEKHILYQHGNTFVFTVRNYQLNYGLLTHLGINWAVRINWNQLSMGISCKHQQTDPQSRLCRFKVWNFKMNWTGRDKRGTCLTFWWSMILFCVNNIVYFSLKLLALLVLLRKGSD